MADPVSLVAGPIVKTVLGLASSLITQKYQLLQGVEGDIKKLSSKLTAIQSVLEDAEEKQLDNRPLRDWLGKLKEAAYDAHDILETFATEACLWQKKQQVQNIPRPFSATETAYKLEAASEIKEILARLDEIAKEKEQFHLNVNDNDNRNTYENRNTGSFVVEADVVGREDDKNKDNKSCHVSEISRHVSLLCKDVEEPVLQIIEKSKKLRTLLLPSEHHKAFGQALDKLFHSLKYIRVLDLSSSTLMELPNSIEKLKLLYYLDLSKTEIKELPNSICSLHNLQTLKLLGCLWLFKLPKDLGNLTNLQHLELDDIFWVKSSTLPPSMGRLTRLQNLHAFQIIDKPGYGIDELKDMNCLKGALHISKLENAVNAADAKLKDKEKLQKVVFEWSSSDGSSQDEEADERVLEDLQPHSDLQVLQLFCYKGTRFPSWMGDGLLQNVVTLSLKDCSKCKVLPLGQLEKLRDIRIKGMLELEEWPEALYTSLLHLKISNCPKLGKLPSIFHSVTVLKITKCHSLKTLPLTPSLRFSILVDNPVLGDWNERRFHFVNDQGEVVALLGSSFSNLLELKVIKCPKLTTLPQLFFPQKLEISECQLLNALPIPEHSRRLQHLALDACHGGTLVRKIPETSSLYSLVISNISGLTCLPKLPQLSGLKALYIHSCSDLVSLSEEGSSVQGLPSLKLLSIRNCPQLVTLPEQGLPATIECLTIGSCPGLKFLEIDHPKDIPDPNAETEVSSPPWYRQFICCKGGSGNTVQRKDGRKEEGEEGMDCGRSAFPSLVATLTIELWLLSSSSPFSLLLLYNVLHHKPLVQASKPQYSSDLEP
ncbi:hypothetical protein TEA_009112 [Camellia sinensis var. sinensis]|uniref:Uncharacterized protein n=1 Tax=Camellia sinensis var. sinensis TaxID=542762 RepID=A0A4S4DXP2_CAMSN|nr:hypothetical protein TEA_009112 [Camellia sinensis var. sinensis]